MTPFSIAGVQMEVNASGENVTQMRQKLALTMARFPWVDMVIFSELAPYGPLHNNHPDDMEETIDSFKAMAQKHNVWLIPGSFFEKRNGRSYNTTVVINPQGEIVGRYDKMFPFLPYESGVTGGSEFLVFDVPDVGRFAMSICYDIWFPETTRTMTALGAEVIIHPVLTGTTDRDVELSIARATAAQFQCYVIDVNGLNYGGIGRSCVHGPGGVLMHQASVAEEIFPVEIDLDVVRHQRKNGLNGLGQLLKSYRDRNVDFKVYDRRNFDHSYHRSLGELKMPTQNNPKPSAEKTTNHDDS